jgi:matrix metalloproteinase-14 (membrane-inserted)
MAAITIPVRWTLLAITLATSVVLSRDTIVAYTASGSWNRSEVVYHVNPLNLDLPEAAVEAGVSAGASVWADQSLASFAFTYGGRSAQTANTNDGLNLVVFRNSAGSGAIATTYWWSNSSGIIDADIVFWDAAYRFFSGTSGCSGGFYIEDIAAHEFGHALGLGHSAITSATMYPSTSSCNQRNRTLDADDIAGVQALYPPRATPPAPPTGFRISG